MAVNNGCHELVAGVTIVLSVKLQFHYFYVVTDDDSGQGLLQSLGFF